MDEKRNLRGCCVAMFALLAACGDDGGGGGGDGGAGSADAATLADSGGGTADADPNARVTHACSEFPQQMYLRPGDGGRSGIVLCYHTPTDACGADNKYFGPGTPPTCADFGGIAEGPALAFSVLPDGSDARVSARSGWTITTFAGATLNGDGSEATNVPTDSSIQQFIYFEHTDGTSLNLRFGWYDDGLSIAFLNFVP